MTSWEAIEAVKAYHKEAGDYELQIGFVEQHSDGTWAVEVFYKWKLNAWEKSVHRIDHCVDTPKGIVVCGVGYTLDFKEEKIK